MIKLLSLGLLCLSLLLGCSSNSQQSLALASLEDGSGFGGTGIIQRLNDDEGSGFGGTGIVGNIRAFGSIWVNGIEIEYDPDVLLESNLTINNQQLKLGQQVILETDVALTPHGLPKTQKITIFYPIAGKIEAAKEHHIKVQNQWVKYSENTYKDDDLDLSIGNYVLINATQNNKKQWIASRLNLNTERHTQYQIKMDIKFSEHINTLIIDPNLARMQWEHQSSSFNHNKSMVIGQWDNNKQDLVIHSIQQRPMRPVQLQPHSSMDIQRDRINLMDSMRSLQRDSTIRDRMRTMPHK